MIMDLRNQRAVRTALFVRIDVPGYAVLRFSDHDRDYTLFSEVYSSLGQLMGVSDTQSELRSTTGELSITISGIPNASIAEIVNNRVRGSSVQVWRVLFDAVTAVELPIAGNPAGRFQGIVNNYSISETLDPGSATNTVLITCTSVAEVLANKVAGRRTNPIDQKQFYPGDVSMDRVLRLANANLDFGAPK